LIDKPVVTSSNQQALNGKVTDTRSNLLPPVDTPFLLSAQSVCSYSKGKNSLSKLSHKSGIEATMLGTNSSLFSQYQSPTTFEKLLYNFSLACLRNQTTSLVFFDCDTNIRLFMILVLAP
jgi:hypothetical protein